MDSRQLKYLVAVAEERNISRAATRLSLSQPTLTRHIQALEDELGVLLFKRTTWGVQLTEAGEALLIHARSIQNHIQLVIEHAQSQAHGQTERLDIGAFGAVLLTYLPGILEAHAKKFPAVETVIHNQPKEQMVESLRQGRLLVFFDRLVPDFPDLRKEKVMREPVLVALNRNNPLSRKATINFTELRDQPMINGRFSAHTRAPVQVLAEHYRFDMQVSQTSDNLISAVSMVAGGFGSCIVPQSMQILRLPNVVYRPLVAEIEVGVDLYCIFRPGVQPMLLQNFLDVVSSHSKT
jgi:LysR family transcriptional regulator, benzoate and cis,cis-muconate-responsive activator of ben and cat genes